MKENKVPEALEILREAMKDKSPGELYDGWMCNIKYAVFDSIGIDHHVNAPLSMTILEGCEDGAKMFLDRLLKEEVK